MKSTKEMNHVIANYMELKNGIYPSRSGKGYWETSIGSIDKTDADLLPYHTSWDWLIPVMAKVYKQSKSLDDGKKWRLGLIILSFDNHVIENNIEFAHRCVYDAIELINVEKD